MQEYELDSILEQYDVAVISTRKTRGAILCDTDKGLLLLKEVDVSQTKTPALLDLYEYLESQGYVQADFPMKNKGGEYISAAEDGTRYMLKRWADGRECDIRKTAELLKASGNLAKLHILMRGKREHNVPLAQHLKEEYMRHNRELKKVRRFMRGVSPKGEFEFSFLKYFDGMYRWADAALTMLEESGYEGLYKECADNFCLTHGEYNYHNIMMCQQPSKNILMTTNFERFKREIQVEDLYYFLRKVLEKQGWKERLGDNMLNAYSAIKPISKEEMEYLLIRLIYPEKFWKIADSYYRSNKAWISAKSIEKINVAIRQTEEKEKFLNNIFAFHL
ncbi:MAG: CotS family spore coat protein [Lachnospiraceae bacterium]